MRHNKIIMLKIRLFTRVLMALASNAAALTYLPLAHAQTAVPLLEEVRTIASETQPIVRELQIPEDGDYQITLADLEQPARLDRVQLAVTRGATVVTALTGPEVNRGFSAQAGAHVIRVVGIPKPAGGSFGVVVKRAGSTEILQFAEALRLPTQPPEGQIFIERTIEIATAGDYELTVSDMRLPQSLSDLMAAITPLSTSSPAPIVSVDGTTPSATFTVQPGSYRLLAVGQAVDGINAGLFSVSVRRSGGAGVFTETVPIGAVSLLSAADLIAGPHVFRLADIAFPAPLASVKAVVVSGGQLATRRDVPGESPFTASAANYSVYVHVAAAATPGIGSYGVEIQRSGGPAVLAEVRTVGGGTGAVPAYSFPIDVPAAGVYRAQLADFGFPATFATLSIAASQGGALLGSRETAGSMDLNLAAGRVFLLVLAEPAPSTRGVFGVDLAPAAGGNAMFEVTQGAGGLFGSRQFTISETARHDVSVVDLGFPARFRDLAAVVTRGSERLGSIFGGGTFRFDATPGSYFINFIADGALLAPDHASSQQKAGTYAITVAKSAPVPTATLTASSTQVTSGGTVNLNWSSTNATECTASGAWSGARNPSGGPEPSPPITSSTTFKLTCTGPGGSADASVTVQTAANQGGGGGGGNLDWLALLSLAALALYRATRAGGPPEHTS